VVAWGRTDMLPSLPEHSSKVKEDLSTQRGIFWLKGRSYKVLFVVVNGVPLHKFLFPLWILQCYSYDQQMSVFVSSFFSLPRCWPHCIFLHPVLVWLSWSHPGVNLSTFEVLQLWLPVTINEPDNKIFHWLCCMALKLTECTMKRKKKRLYLCWSYDISNLNPNPAFILNF